MADGCFLCLVLFVFYQFGLFFGHLSQFWICLPVLYELCQWTFGLSTANWSFCDPKHSRSTNEWHKNNKFWVFELPRQYLDLYVRGSSCLKSFSWVKPFWGKKWAKKKSCSKWNFLLYLTYLILKFVWWSETFTCDIMQTGRYMFFSQHKVETQGSFLCTRKSLSWHTALRIRRKSEKRDKEGRKMENGYRKSQDSLANKVSVKVESRKIMLPT